MTKVIVSIRNHFTKLFGHSIIELNSHCDDPAAIIENLDVLQPTIPINSSLLTLFFLVDTLASECCITDKAHHFDWCAQNFFVDFP